MQPGRGLKAALLVVASLLGGMVGAALVLCSWWGDDGAIMSLIGALLGGLFTLAAGFLAWRGVQAQIADLRQQREADKEQARLFARTYCAGMAEKIEGVRMALRDLIEPHPHLAKISDTFAAQQVRKARESLAANANGVLREDVEAVLHQVPITSWASLREVFALDAALADMVEQCAAAGGGEVPISAADRIVVRLNEAAAKVARAIEQLEPK